MSKQLLLPKTDKEGVSYLSYSQISTWLRSKREYMRQYFFGEGFTGNAYTDFGSKVGEALENNDFSGFTAKEQKFLKTVPRLDEFEREIHLNMKGFYVKGFIDTNSSPDGYVKELADYKTGDIEKKSPEYESDDYTQLDIYSLAMLQEYGKLPDHVKVYLIGRSGNAFKNEKLKLTNEYATIIKKVTPERAEQVRQKVQRVAEEISEYYTVFLKVNQII
jgi:hypothetical protein